MDRKDLGIHTEVFTSGMMHLIKKGVVTNLEKTLHKYHNVFTFAIGDQEVYDFINNNPSMLCLPASYTNEPTVIGKNDNMISVNAFVEIDLFGQVNAEFMVGHQFSGVGGQLDFIRGVKYSKNGKTILASSATAAHGKVSRIVPKLSAIATDTRLDVDYVTTEYGIVRLSGLSTTERAKALISIADPKFREELTKQAIELNIF
jgi:itaconate CoA-transferase